MGGIRNRGVESEIGGWECNLMPKSDPTWETILGQFKTKLFDSLSSFSLSQISEDNSFHYSGHNSDSQPPIPHSTLRFRIPPSVSDSTFDFGFHPPDFGFHRGFQIPTSIPDSTLRFRIPSSISDSILPLPGPRILDSDIGFHIVASTFHVPPFRINFGDVSCMGN